jgi:transposase
MVASPQTKRVQIIVSFGQTHCISATAREVGCSRNTVKKWVEAWKANQDVASLKDKPRSGRRRVLSDTAADLAVDLLLDDNFDGAQHVASELIKRGLANPGLSRWTVNRAAKAAAEKQGQPIQAKRGKPVKMLSPATKQKRLRFAEANKRRSWKHVMFTDST